MSAPPCPRCGGALKAIALDWQTAPWLCAPCSRGWFQTEVENAHLYRHAFNDFGYFAFIPEGVQAELAVARRNGTSLRVDQLFHVPPHVLTAIEPLLRNEDMRAHVRNRLEGQR